MNQSPYGDPQAMRQAIDERLRRLQRERRGSLLSDLQRQFAYDRLLCRVFRADPHRWVLKGATAMLARLGGLARHSLDVDLYSSHRSLSEAEQALSEAAAIDLGDYFRFALRPARQMPQAVKASRIGTEAYLGATKYADFNVDLVTGIDLRNPPDDVPPLVPMDLPGLIRSNYLAWPIADHIADKLCAMIELHPRRDGGSVPSTRFRDLADLALFAHSITIDGKRLRNVLESEAQRRGLRLPDAVPAPDGSGWRSGYSRLAREVPILVEKDVDSAMTTVKRFLDPVLSSSLIGTWNPERLMWSA